MGFQVPNDKLMKNLFNFIPAADDVKKMKQKYFCWQRPKEEADQVIKSREMIKAHNDEMDEACQVDLGQFEDGSTPRPKADEPHPVSSESSAPPLIQSPPVPVYPDTYNVQPSTPSSGSISCSYSAADSP